MYLQNKYTRIYNLIIERAKQRNLSDYKERHHIIPQSLGGDNELSNLVYLTAREHFICHRLLVKMTSGKEKSKMSQAAWMMVVVGQGQHRYKINNRTYEHLRLEMSAVKKSMSTWNKGITPKDETRLRLRKATLEHLVKVGRMTKEVADYKNSLPLPAAVYKAKNSKKSKI
jgi:hypothetical protein